MCFVGLVEVCLESNFRRGGFGPVTLDVVNNVDGRIEYCLWKLYV